MAPARVGLIFQAKNEWASGASPDLGALTQISAAVVT